ncbi:MAG: peptidase M61 [Pseudomonadota bacterium]
MILQLSPKLATSDASRIATIDVELRFSGVTTAAGDSILQMPLVSSNVDTVATVLQGLDVRDAHGTVRLTARDVNEPVRAARDAEIGGRVRDWVADRATSGTLTVRYTVPAQASLPPRGPAPPFAFSNDGDGVSGAGHVLLLLPPGDTAYRTTVSWDLSALPQGARGLSSYGEGRVTALEPLAAGRLRMAFYMAGRIGVWPTKVPERGFFGAWQGTPPFDAAAVMRWTGTLHDRYLGFFGRKVPATYGVFLRHNPINAGGGVGLDHSFVTTFGRPGGPGSDVDELRMTLAHEMFHTFQPYIQEPAGLASSWFGEGLATFYQRRLPLRFGLISPQRFLKDLNFHAGRYYTSAMATAPNADVPKRFWADTRIRTLPYDRGMLYFATIDDAVRKKSGGRRSLDNLMLEMLRLEQGGRQLTNADWEALLDRELGAGAVTDFRAFLDGRMPVPASSAFGPCFQRTTVPLRRYELGFDSAVLAEPKRIVRGLVAGSAAAAAGLRDGDDIVVPVPQDAIQGIQDQRLALSIRRNGEALSITYLPRGETVAAYQWQRVAGVPDTACAL